NYLEEEYVEVLSGWRYGEARQLTVAEFYLALARLGGHLNRRRDHPPGWLVLWRGWAKLRLMVEGARAARRARPRPPAVAAPGPPPPGPDPPARTDGGAPKYPPSPLDKSSRQT